MKRYFNTTGPCRPDEHYMLPPLARCREVAGLIARGQYFVIHAARQSGKTTLLMELAKQLNTHNVGLEDKSHLENEQYHALYCSLEGVQGINDPKEGIPAIVKAIAEQIKNHAYLEKYSFAEGADYSNYTNILRATLTSFCKSINLPLIILFDEVDCLANGTLISFLRQIRSGYSSRSITPFVHSVALIGMRNIRDYKSKIREDRETLGSASPFNIVAESLTLQNFTQEEIGQLYAQHTGATGQLFSYEVVAKVYHYTQGQPWLVNAVARQIMEKMLGNDVSQPILPEYVEQAAQAIILRRDTHIDSLMERLKEERVQRVIEPLIMGQLCVFDPLSDDRQFSLDLGLVRLQDQRLVPANPIYAEVMVRMLSDQAQAYLDNQSYPPKATAYLVDGKLDMRRLLSDFQRFWRENSEMWLERYQYKEAAPHLVLQAFLQRLINAGGRIHREMALGSGRLDLCVEYPKGNFGFWMRNFGFDSGQDALSKIENQQSNNLYPIELKIRRDTKTAQEGQAQLATYLDRLGCTEGWLILFDRRKSIAWSKKLFWRTTMLNGKTIHTVGC